MRSARKGYGLAEAIVGVAVFAVFAVAIYQAAIIVIRAVQLSKAGASAVALANEEFEIAHNLPYASVGNVGGAPPGKLPSTQSITRNGSAFSIKTVVRAIDDPFDGTIGGAPNDLSPADYKIVEVTVTCTSCVAFPPMIFNTIVAPKALEGSNTNGALFVKVFDANGQPVSGAAVHVASASTTPPVTIDDVTGTNGMLQLVDMPPGTTAYAITVSKTGYSSDRTYPPNGGGNPHPSKPDATVAADTLTQVSFAIDKTSTLSVSTVTPVCAAVAVTPFTLTGSKIIGTTPTVYKYTQSFTTDGSGLKTVSGVEWDTYTYANTSALYDLAGTVPLSPFNLPPGSTQNLQIILSPKASRALLVTVHDAATGLPVSGATVTLTQGASTIGSAVTGRGFLRQTDWSGGAGQTDLADATKYFSDDGNMSGTSIPGDLRLKSFSGLYPSSGTLISSAFDTGSVSNFYDLTFLPTGQPAPTGPNPVLFQLAANNDDSTWSYTGPDGTVSSWYSATNTNISSTLNGNRYLRYKAKLSTTTATSTPVVSDVAFTFTSSCVPPGQVLFNSLASGTYTVNVTKGGYQNYTASTSVSSNWQAFDAAFQPQ